MIEFGMLHPRTGAHELRASRSDDTVVPGGIAMLELTLDDVRDDFHIPMRMGWKTFSRLHDVVVEHAKRAPIHIARVMILGKAE